MSSIIETVDVEVPVRTAYDQWTQFEEFPAFMEGVEEIRQTDATHNHWKINIAGVRREFDAEVTEQRPDERVAWRSVSGTGHAGVVTFHRLDDTHTRVTLQLDTAPEGVVETLGDKLGLVSRRAKNDMVRFKEYIESRGQQSGAWRGEVQRPDERGSVSDPGYDTGYETTTSGLAAAGAAATAAGSGYALDSDPYTEDDTYTTASARDLSSGDGGPVTSADTDPYAGIASSTDTGGLGPAVGEGALSGPYADNPGGAPVYGSDGSYSTPGFEPGSHEGPDVTADPGYGSLEPGTTDADRDARLRSSASYDDEALDLTEAERDDAPLVGGESTRPRDPRINPL